MSAENIYQKWLEQRNFAEHERLRLPVGSPERHDQHERQRLIDEFLYDLRSIARELKRSA